MLKPGIPEHYLPRVNSRGRRIESADHYLERARDLLPNFPPDVLRQRFYDHWSDIDRFAWLNFVSLSFMREKWTTDRLLSCGAERHQNVLIYQRDFESGTPSLRSRRIARYMSEHGTWPIAPLLIENLAGKLAYPHGTKLQTPFHPIEGQHRFAVFLSFAKKGLVCAEHEIWRISLG